MNVPARAPMSVPTFHNTQATESAAPTDPPAPRTPTSANCDAPVNIASERKHACAAENPDVTAAAPKASPDGITATATAIESMYRRRGVTRSPARPGCPSRHRLRRRPS